MNQSSCVMRCAIKTSCFEIHPRYEPQCVPLICKFCSQEYDRVAVINVLPHDMNHTLIKDCSCCMEKAKKS